MDEIAKKLKPIELPLLPEKPLVSVLMANYNYGKYVAEAIESVLHQTYPHFEILVCDDGSTDNSLEVISNYVRRDSRVKLIAKGNGGLASALNAAYAASSGEILSLLDADDTFQSTKLHEVADAFRKSPRSGLSIHRVIKMDKEGRRFSYARPIVLIEGWIAAEALRKGGHVRSLPPASGLSFRRAVLELLFPIPMSLRRVVDAYVSHTAQFVTGVCNVPGILAHQRLHGENITSGNGFNVAIVERFIGDLRLLNEVQRDFLAKYWGVEAAEQLQLRDHSHYWSFLLLLHVLCGNHSQEVCGERVTDIVGHLQGLQGMLARVLLSLPRRLSQAAVECWAGQSASTAMIMRAARSWLQI